MSGADIGGLNLAGEKDLRPGGGWLARERLVRLQEANLRPADRIQTAQFAGQISGHWNLVGDDHSSASDGRKSLSHR
jgi:hypothetical protein